MFVVQISHHIFLSAAWAHLILYGEEATKQAQKEGEEAAAAYEQEKRDIAEGKIPAAPPQPEKKKRKPAKKKTEGKEDGADEGEGEEKTTKKKRGAKDEPGGEKKKQKGGDKESLVPILNKSIGKVKSHLARFRSRFHPLEFSNN
jgi:hypothetical protein